MFSKTVHAISRSSNDIVNLGAERMRGLTLGEARDLVRFARRRLREEMLPQVAGSLTFTTTLALVPLLTIVLAIFTTFPIFGQLRTALETYFAQALMPKAISNTIIANLTQFADKAKGLSLLGAVMLFFTSTAMMGMIERVFNQIWRVRRPRPLMQRMLVYWALITLGPLLFGLSISFTGQLFTATGGMAQSVPLLGSALSTPLATVFSTLASLALTTGAYTLLYVTVPNRSVDWRDALWGALAAAIAFELAKRLFALFIRQFPTYAIIYGALAALPLFLLWMYLSWLITLLGAVLAAALPTVKYERWWHVPAPGGAFIDAMAVLKVLHGGAHATGSALVPAGAIRAHTRIGYDELDLLLEQMAAAGWVGRVQAEGAPSARWTGAAVESWVLLADADKLRVADVYRLFVFGGAHADLAPAARQVAGSPLSFDPNELARQVEGAVAQGLEQPISAYFAGR
ncbi:YihY family inner membrane protein [Massilia niabensis]|uniref:UPF0761 membrane protein ACFPN5_12910 n=1 Tax=Massilia niabensis TaxID=544910 RepID=A0ABW0L6L7_9BURK